MCTPRATLSTSAPTPTPPCGRRARHLHGATPADVSIIAKIVSSTFDQFTASNGYKFSRLDMGTVNPETMFQDAKTENTVMAWILRVTWESSLSWQASGWFSLPSRSWRT